MSQPLTGGIAKAVYQGAKAAKLGLPATLIKVTAGTRTPNNVSGGTNPTTTSYACYGFVSDFAVTQIDGTLIAVNDRKIDLYGYSIASGTVAPTTGDEVTIAGGTYRIKHVDTDPAQAMWVCITHGAAI
jgi:hypothetical protein